MSEDFPQNDARAGMPQGTVVESAPLPEYLEKVQSLQAEFEAEVPSHIVLDDDRFERTIYDVGDGVSMVFRGREELPTFGASDGGSDVTRGVVGIDEKPKHTSGDRYGTWTVAITKGEPYDDVFERAAKTGSDRVELIASSSARGIVEASIKLVELGKGDPSATQRLEALRRSLVDGVIDDDVLKLYDDIFVASTVDAESNNLLAHNINPGGAGQLDEHAPMQVALALAGDPTAVELLKAKQEKVAVLEGVDEIRQRNNEGRTPEDAEVKEPGQRLTEEELEVLKDAHFVAVHTTDINPVQLTDGLRVMRPAAEFDKDNPNKSSRSTLHWSLNHPVESHIGGNFAERQYTIVAPLEDMARVNGAPAVLNGVDSYFTTNPAEGLLIPDRAIVIHTHEDSERPLIQRNGDEIELKTGNFTSDDISQAVDHLANQYYVRFKDKGWDESTARFAAKKFIVESLATHANSTFRDIAKLHISDEEKIDMQPHEFEIPAHSRGIFRALQQNGVDVDSLADRWSQGDNIYDEFEKGMQAALEAVIENGQISAYPELHSILGEALRKRVVDDTIQDLGGEVVRSDGTSAYIETAGFSDKVDAVVKKVGLRSGLHVYQPEATAETVVDSQLQDAITTIPVPLDVNHPDGITKARADFDWTKFDGTPIWQTMAGSRTPWAVRRQLVDRGLLTYTQQKRDPDLEASML